MKPGQAIGVCSPGAHGTHIGSRTAQGQAQGRDVELGVVGKDSNDGIGADRLSSHPGIGPLTHDCIGHWKTPQGCKRNSGVDNRDPVAELASQLG